MELNVQLRLCMLFAWQLLLVLSTLLSTVLYLFLISLLRDCLPSLLSLSLSISLPRLPSSRYLRDPTSSPPPSPHLNHTMINFSRGPPAFFPCLNILHDRLAFSAGLEHSRTGSGF
jgi:hypothetical protein